MPKTLYIHVGPEKTGTTAIQHVLRQHDNSVLVYPRVGEPKNGVWGNQYHHTFVLKFYGKKRETPDNLGQLFEEVATLTRGNNLDVLISSEILSLRDDIGAFVEELARHVSDAPVDVEILFVCREHFERAASRYGQRLRRGDERDPDQFLTESATELCYRPMVRELRKTGYRVTALNYHPSHGLVERFFKHVGFAEHQIPKPERRNVSLSTKALIAKLAANRTLESKFDKRKGSLKYLKKMSAFKGSSRFIFSREAAATAELEFSSDREFLRSEFGVELPVLNLEEQENMFFLDAVEFSDIVQVTRKMGSDGEKIAEVARGFVRQ